MSKIKQKTAIILIIVTIILAAIIFGVVFLLNNYILPNMQYKDAKKAIEANNYTEAYTLLTELENHEKAEKLLEKFEYKLVSVKDEKENPYELYKYDSNGNCLVGKKFTYESGTQTEKRHTYKYNEDGQQIKDIYVTALNGETQTKDTIKFAYDDFGNRISEKSSLGTLTLTYDENGRKIGESYVTSLYKIVTIYEYENGLLRAEKSYCNDIYQDDYIIEYFYDASGRPIKKSEQHYDFYGTDTVISTMKYNDEGLLISKIEADAEYTYKYDENNLCTEEKCVYKNGKGSILKYTVYNEFGSPQTVKTVASGKTVTLTYEYEVFYNPEKQVEKATSTTSPADTEGQPSKDELQKIYSEKINEYRAAFKLSPDELLNKYPNDQIINATAYDKIRKDGTLQYALYDVDKNGTDELVIGIGDTLIDIYSVSKGELKKLFKDCNFGFVNKLHILSNGILLYEGNDSTYSGSFIKHYLKTDKNGGLVLDSIGSKFYNNRITDGKNIKNMLTRQDYTKICNIMLKTTLNSQLDWQPIG